MADINLGGSLKDLGGVLTTFAGLLYASGYLVLHARAHALGTDPNLALLEGAYLFAGFRFLWTLLIAVFLMLPIIAIIQAAVLWLIRAIPASAQAPAQWVTIVILAVIVLLEFLVVLNVHHVLIEGDRDTATPNPILLVDAVLGRNRLGLGLVLGTAALAALSLCWLKQYGLPTELSAFSVSLAIFVTLQMLFLPVYHGTFFADRSVRVLDGVPAQVSSLLKEPVGIVDRDGNYVTLFGTNKDGKRRLVMIGKEEIKGLGIRNVTPLRTFLDMLTKTTAVVVIVAPVALGADVSANTKIAQSASKVEMRTTMDTKEANTTFWKVVVDYLKNTFEYVGSLGEGRAEAGQVWIADVDGIRLRGPARLLASFQQLSWPVFGPDGYIYALEEQHVVRINRGGEKVVLVGSQAKWLKLIGVSSDGSVLGIVDDPPLGKVAILRQDGTLTLGTAPSTEEDRKRQGVLLQESRAYSDGRRLTISYATRGRGLDIFLKTPGTAATNLSDCGDDACGQPSLSPDGIRVAWIRSELN